MATLKSETGNDAASFVWILVNTMIGLGLLITGMDYLGIAIPNPESMFLRVLMVIALAATGLVLLVAAEMILDAIMKKIMQGLANLAARSMRVGDRLADAIASLCASGAEMVLRILHTALSYPFQLVHQAFIAPWLERRRQERELKDLFENVRDKYDSFEEFKRAFNGEEDRQESARNKRDQAKDEAAPPPADKFQEACRLLGLADTGTFTQAEFSGRYRKLMKAVHPDLIGENPFASQLNEARDLIKSRKGWK